MHGASALAYLAHVASRDCQRTLYVESGGQPGRKSNWEDEGANALAAGYFRATPPAIEHAWVRPRFAGFVDVQNRPASAMSHFLKDRISTSEAFDELNACLE